MCEGFVFTLLGLFLWLKKQLYYHTYPSTDVLAIHALLSPKCTFTCAQVCDSLRVCAHVMLHTRCLRSASSSLRQGLLFFTTYPKLPSKFQGCSCLRLPSGCEEHLGLQTLAPMLSYPRGLGIRTQVLALVQ